MPHVQRVNLPDLTVSALGGICLKAPGPALKVEGTVRNLAGAVGTGSPFVTSVTGRIFLPAGHGPNPDQIVSQQVNVGDHATAADFSGSASFSFQIPIPIGTTSVQLKAQADRNGQVQESNESNNSRSYQFTCTFN